MSDENRRSRRRVLQTSGLLLGGGLLSGVGHAEPNDRFNTDFHPSALREVKRFAQDVFDANQDPFQQLRRWSETGEKDSVFNRLSEEQIEALLDSVRPSILVNQSISLKSRGRGKRVTGRGLPEDSVHRSIEAKVDENNPIEKWNWDADIVREELKSRNVVGTPVREQATKRVSTAGATQSETHSEYISAIAISLDWKAYELTGFLHWDYTGSEAENPNADTQIGYTNSVTWHEDTDTDVSEQETFVQGNWKVTFKNGAGEICDPVVGWVCISLAQTFEPYMTLRGDSNGNGETVDSGDDALDGDFIFN